jgi:hypothetical protein
VLEPNNEIISETHVTSPRARSLLHHWTQPRCMARDCRGSLIPQH